MFWQYFCNQFVDLILDTFSVIVSKNTEIQKVYFKRGLWNGYFGQSLCKHMEVPMTKHAEQLAFASSYFKFRGDSACVSPFSVSSTLINNCYRTTLADTGQYTINKTDTNWLFLRSMCAVQLSAVFVVVAHSTLWTCSRFRVSDSSLLLCTCSCHAWLMYVRSQVCLYRPLHSTRFGCKATLYATRHELTSTSISTAYMDCMNGLSANNDSRTAYYVL